jgi:hypothetical protein
MPIAAHWFQSRAASVGALSRSWAPRLGSKVARFRRVNEEKQYAHHDALELPSGEVVLLTRLLVGQIATVLQLPASGHPTRFFQEGDTALGFTGSLAAGDRIPYPAKSQSDLRRRLTNQ